MDTRKRATVLAASLVAAGSLLLAPGVASAAPSPATPDHHGHGIAAFQEAHGLKPTGKVDTSTGKALQNASDKDAAQTFTTPADLDADQLANARTVIGVGKGNHLDNNAQIIALMTAMQESKFVNYTTPVDHDSLGIFQQRPSTGWGTPAQITNVILSSESFYGVAPFGNNAGLIQISGWESMPKGDACQAVQGSAYPDRYAQWESFATDLLNQQGPTVDPIPNQG